MINKLRNYLHQNTRSMRSLAQSLEDQKILLAQNLMARWPETLPIGFEGDWSFVEFKVFSQFGDDGIIQWLIKYLPNIKKTFIEFGVEDYSEANTRFLLQNNNWSGLILDGSKENILKIESSPLYWRHTLKAKTAFITKENINDLISTSGFLGDLGILHIDIDGNDYWVWEAIECVDPAIVIVEFNSIFGNERAITVPYDKDFIRSNKHYSHLYFGASLPAFNILARKKGYSLVGCNSAGNNAYFVKKELLNNHIKALTLDQAYRKSMFRESRNEAGELTFLSHLEGRDLISDLEFIEIT